MKKPILLILCLFLSSFLSLKSKKSEQDLLSRKETLTNQIISHTSKVLKKRHLIAPMGFGARAMEQVEFLSIMFQVRRHLSAEEGRVMIVDCVEEFLKNINQNQELRPYLKKYPFTPEDVGIIFYVYDQKGYDYYYPDVSIIDASHNKISYETLDKPKNYKIISLFEESFEDAFKLVQKNKEELNSNQTAQQTTDLIKEKED